MSAADFYTGIVPDVYAALRGTTFDASPYLDFVREHGEPALELGCGDDGPFFELVRQGMDVEGVDSSRDMLDRAHSRAEAEGLQIVTHCQTMQGLRLPRRYRSIYLAGPTFTLLPDDEAALQTLRSIAAHLDADGRVMVPLWIPQPTSHADLGLTRETTTADGSIARYTVESEEYDVTSRTRRTLTRYELRAGERAEVVQREWVIHWHTPQGFADLAAAAGLGVVSADPIVDGEFTVYLALTDAAASR